MEEIDYSLEGIGASKFPFHVFTVGHKSGLIQVTQILDRENIAIYNVSDKLQIRFNSNLTDGIWWGFFNFTLSQNVFKAPSITDKKVPDICPFCFSCPV